MNRLAIALAALGEPSSESRRQALGLNAKTGLQSPFAGGKRVVKFSRTGEVPHAKAVEPFERAGPAVAADIDVNFEFARVHSGKV